ncbi:cell division protein FtsA [Verrucomicrobiota bacterium]
MANDPLIALEIGTAKVRVLVGDVQQDGTLRIANTGECEARGIRKGEVIDYQAALGSLREAIDKAEQEGDIDIGFLSLVLSGGETESLLNQGHISITNTSNEPGDSISEEDMKRAMKIASKPALSREREVVHALKRNYVVDNVPDRNPEGRFGYNLTAESLILHSRRGSLETLRRMIEDDMEIDCDAMYFSAVSAAQAVLTDELMKAGVLLIDLGAGTSDFIVYQDGAPTVAGSIAVGGDHVTHDISVGLNIARGQAEQIKVKHGSAIIDTMAATKTVSVPSTAGFRGTVVKKAALHTIIHARMEETFQLVKARLDEKGIGSRLGGGVVLVGGGACLQGAADLAHRVFCMPAHIGKVNNTICLPGSSESVQYAATVGCLHLAKKRQDERGSIGLVPAWLQNFLRKSNG